jgi:hypothetical protein
MGKFIYKDFQLNLKGPTKKDFVLVAQAGYEGSEKMHQKESVEKRRIIVIRRNQNYNIIIVKYSLQNIVKIAYLGIAG